MGSHRRFGAGPVVALALLAGGCRDGGATAATVPEDPPATSAPLSPAEFAARADLICIETASHFGELEDPDGVGEAP